jgi:hypothetical protein
MKETYGLWVCAGKTISGFEISKEGVRLLGRADCPPAIVKKFSKREKARALAREAKLRAKADSDLAARLSR